MFFSSYLDELERKGGTGLIAYSCLLEGGINGPEIRQLKRYFNLVQLKSSQRPEEMVFEEFINVFEIPFIMMAMGYYPSETEVNRINDLLFSTDGYRYVYIKRFYISQG